MAKQAQTTFDTSNLSDTSRAEARYRALFEYAPEGILICNAECCCLDANPSILNMLGYSKNELLGLHITDIIVEREAEMMQSIIGRISTNENFNHDWHLKRKNGLEFNAEIIATKMPDGNLLGIVRNTTIIKEQQREIAQLSRLYSALTEINQAIIWLPDQDQLFNSLCKILVEKGGFKMAWVGWNDSETNQLIPVAVYGDDNDYLSTIKVYSDDRPEGRGPSGLSFRSGQPYICNDMQKDDATLAWREEINNRGFRASAAFPIRYKNNVSGTISVYADQALFFQDKEITLLKEAVDNISFALENLAREESRRKAENLAKNESLFSDMMIESMPGILYFYDNEGKFLRWNHNFQVVSGYSNEEIANMHPLDFFSAEEKLTLAEKISDVFQHGQAFVEASLLTKDGEKIPYLFTGRSVNFKDIECLVGMGIDISGRVNAESKLDESEQKYRELVESANSIILRWNSQGNVTFLNSFGQHFFGYTADEIVGQPIIGTIVPATDSVGDDLQDLMQQICLDTKVFEQNINENMLRNGQRVWVSWTNKVVLDAEGQVVEILSIGNDITDSLRAEKEIRELNASLEIRVAERTEELQSALVRAEAADKIKSAFLATMSHELRTPLNSIIGFTGIILQGMTGPLNSEQTRQLGMVKGSAKHLLELINDVLDISKIEAGQLEVRSDSFNLKAMIERVITLQTPVVEKKGLILQSSIASDISEITSDRRRLEQVLINLINNAVKFTEKGSITITAELINNFQSTDSTDTRSYIKIKVADTGIGIKNEDLKLLFQPFRQIDSGLSRMHEGTGLGLAICRRLLELMGGHISATSEWSKGTEFTVMLPLQGSLKS